MSDSRESDTDDVAYFHTLRSQRVWIDGIVAHLPDLCPALEPLLEHAKETAPLGEISQLVLSWVRDLDPNAQARRRGFHGGGRGF